MSSRDCPNCGAEVPPSATQCDFCDLTISEMGRGTAGAVPLEHRLGDGAKIGKTFEDSVSEHKRALAQSWEAERRSRLQSFMLKVLVLLLLVMGGVTALYQLVVRAGWAEAALNGVMFSVINLNYDRAHGEADSAKKILPREAEPYYLDAGIYLIEVIRPHKPSRPAQLSLSKADTALSRALLEDSDHGPSRFYMAVVRVLQGQHEEAEAHLEKALKALSDDPESEQKKAYQEAAQDLLDKLGRKQKIIFYSGASMGPGIRVPDREGEVRVPFERYPTY